MTRSWRLTRGQPNTHEDYLVITIASLWTIYQKDDDQEMTSCHVYHDGHRRKVRQPRQQQNNEYEQREISPNFQRALNYQGFDDRRLYSEKNRNEVWNMNHHAADRHSLTRSTICHDPFKFGK
jgi:hypothetical protein